MRLVSIAVAGCVAALSTPAFADEKADFCAELVHYNLGHQLFVRSVIRSLVPFLTFEIEIDAKDAEMIADLGEKVSEAYRDLTDLSSDAREFCGWD